MISFFTPSANGTSLIGHSTALYLRPIEHDDCLHYCVMNNLRDPTKGCSKAGIVKYETGEQVCSKAGIGGVHGMVVDNQKRYEDKNQFDIFLVMTGGATFDKGESSLRKVKCQKTEDGDPLVLRS